jgi:hypothetical protein
MDKKIKKFYEFINTPNITASNFPLYKLKDTLFLSDKDKPLEYQKRFYNDFLMRNVVSPNMNESNYNNSSSGIRKSIEESDFENDPVEFYKSFTDSTKLEFMSPYTIKDLKEFKLYKISGYKAGFAIKSDGDIILVHNNTGEKGIGDLIMKKAVEYGGIKLDHYDGYLTGFYKSLKFTLKENDVFLDEYTPEGWKFIPVDINNRNTSIYGEEIKASAEEFSEASKRYLEGKPDVVYRSILSE